MLNKHNLSIAALASKEESRYTMNGVLVSPTSTVVTNGHYLIWVSGDDRKSADFPVVPGFGTAQDEFAPFVLHRDTALAIHKVTPSKEGIPILNHVAVRERQLEDGENATARVMAVTDLDRPQVFPVRPIEGKFPQYDAVMPKWEDAKFRITVDTAYLASLAKLFAGFVSDNRNHPVTVSFYGDDKSIRIDGSNEEQGMTAILMPVHGVEDKRGTYGWAEREAKREEEREAARLQAMGDANAELQADADARAAEQEPIAD